VVVRLLHQEKLIKLSNLAVRTQAVYGLGFAKAKMYHEKLSQLGIVTAISSSKSVAR